MAHKTTGESRENNVETVAYEDLYHGREGQNNLLNHEVVADNFSGLKWQESSS
jgi:hypothetical protein